VDHPSSQNRKPLLRLLLLTAVAFLIQGYHPFAEDAEIYLPGVEKILHSNLFPVGEEFFHAHASMTLFPNLIAFSIRITHLPMEVTLFAWQLLSIFLLLLACWELASLLFPNSRARWGSVCLIAALLTLPIAGTALYIVDQYLNPRNLAAFAGVFMLARTLEKKYLRAFLWLIFAAAMHPLMWVFPCSFCILFLVLERWRILSEGPGSQFPAALIFLFPLAPRSSPAYHEAAKRHAYHYIQNWTWYELLGAFAPLLLFWWFARIARTREWRIAERVNRAFIIYGSIYILLALAIDLPARFEALGRIQPLRSLDFLYIVMLIMIGGLLAEFILRHRFWRWLVLFIPLSAGMYLAQRDLFPASAHIEWPGAAPKNPWAQAFLWISHNTPTNALFAIDPYYMDIPGEDEVGFRCLAQRSRLADGVKDNGVVSMFPGLADEWWSQVQAQTPWKNFRAEDFLHLNEKYGVNWIVVQQSVEGIDCPYTNNTVKVCRLP
jgi:hypothetical protein